MENHPIPQDVTGFKFKLIGSVTVKQFLYLLGFGILATIVFVLQINFFIKIPVMLILAGIGLSLAFVPIEGRPMDVMIANFAKAIPSENRYIFRKRGANLASFEFLQIPVVKPIQTTTQQTTHTSPADDKKQLLMTRLRKSSFRPDENEAKALNNLKGLFNNDGPTTPQEAPEPQKQRVIPHFVADNAQETEPLKTQTQTPIAPPVSDEDEIVKIKTELEEAKQEQGASGQPNEDLSKKISELEEQLQQALGDKEALQKQVVGLESQRIQKQDTAYTPSQSQETPQTENVRFVSPSSQLKAGFPSVPDVPNVILGIVEDARGKTLPNILVEVMDLNGIPVRAFKTNTLGQFASATPLANGTYKIYFEDPQKQHEFEVVQIDLNGEIFNPIEVKSVDAREKLRRELFGGTPQQTG